MYDFSSDLLYNDAFDKFAYIKHDNDGKESHYHFLVRFKSARYFNGVVNFFEQFTSQNVMVEPCHNRQKAFEYLTHKNDPDKFQYSSDGIVSNDVEFWTAENDDHENMEFLTDLMTLNIRDMAVKYGRDYIKNYNSYDSFKKQMQYCKEGN